eukprot:10473727-Alexandrium_andersonii.AAC.1
MLSSGDFPYPSSFWKHWAGGNEDPPEPPEVIDLEVTEIDGESLAVPQAGSQEPSASVGLLPTPPAFGQGEL